MEIKIQENKSNESAIPFVTYDHINNNKKLDNTFET
jgi:hypothetical protein